MYQWLKEIQGIFIGRKVWQKVFHNILKTSAKNKTNRNHLKLACNICVFITIKEERETCDRDDVDFFQIRHICKRTLLPR